MNYIASVYTNIKTENGEPVRTELGQFTLLYGENESRKSAVTDAIRLHLSGSTVGLLGRPGEVKAAGMINMMVTPVGDRKGISIDMADDQNTIIMALNGVPMINTSWNVANAFSGSLDKVYDYLTAIGFMQFPYSLDLTQMLTPKQTEAYKEATVIPLHIGSYQNYQNVASVLENRIKSLKDTQAVHANFCKAAEVMCPTGMTSEELAISLSSLPAPHIIRAFLRNIAHVIGTDTVKAVAKAGSEMVQVVRTEAETEEMLKIYAATHYINAVWKEHREMRDSCDDEILQLSGILKVLYDSKEKFFGTMVFPRIVKAAKKYLFDGEDLLITAKGYLGLNRNGRQFLTLSGATYNRMIAVVTCAIADMLAAMPAALPRWSNSIVITDDKQWDMGLLSRTMDKLCTCPNVQVIVPLTQRPEKCGPEWTIVHMEKPSYLK